MYKKILIIFSVPILVLVLLFLLRSFANNHEFKGEGCDEELWQHTYTPQRFKMIKPCTTITGRVTWVFPVPLDGDYHITLKPDPEFSNLKNEKSFFHPNGEIILEPICQTIALIPSAFSACWNFKYKVMLPKPGSHIQATGVLVYDKDASRGYEIHPVSSIKILPD